MGKKSADELTEMLASNNTFMAGCEVIKIKNYTHIMKIESASVTAASTALEECLICFFTRILDDFETDMVGATIETPQGNMHIITTYIPPRDLYLHYFDFYKILKSTDPVYIIGDLNARHLILEHNNKNIRGELLATLINKGHAQHIGPHFPTFLTLRSSASPDIILSSHRTFPNTYASPETILISSDHNYIQFIISSSPLQLPTKERISFKSTNCDTYRDILGTNTILDEDHPTKEEIETQTQSWIN